jgi:hypothetical protein
LTNAGQRARRFTEQVPWDVENREASAFLRMGFKICRDKNLDGLVAGLDFDRDRCIAEIDFVSATIFSPDDREAFTSCSP